MSEWKETEIGLLPLHWDYDKLKNHLLIKGRIGWKGLKISEYVEEGPYIVGGLQIKEEGIDWGECAHVTQERYDESPEIMLKKNDILMTKDGTIGKIAIVSDITFQATVASHIHVIREKSFMIFPRFLFYFFKSPVFKFVVESKISGSVIPALTQFDINNTYFPIPPLSEQKAIAEVLSSLDDKIDLLHRQNKILEKMSEKLFRQWFVEEAKEDWEEGILGDVIDIYDSKRIPLSKMERDKMKEGKLYPYYGAAKIMDYINDYIFDGEYILFGEDGTVRTDEGYPVLQYASGKFWVNNHTHIFRAKAPYNNFFIWNYLSKKNIDKIVTGAVQPKINQTNLKSLEFPIYPNELVNKFIEITNSQFEKINKNKSQICTLEKIRDTLLPKLMSGEVRVND